MRVCVVEDEQSLAEMIQLNLELEGYEVLVLRDGEVAQNVFENGIDFDLIILDVMLPGVNGVDLCKIIRKDSIVPVLFLSAKGTTADRIEGLKAGANDYLPKPFDLEELLLRTAILTQNITDESIKIGNFEVNFKTYEVFNKQKEIVASLSKKEVGLIRLFQQRNGEVVSRTEILDKVWGKDQFPTTRTIDNYILNFRKIFEKDPKNPDHFHSVRGVGYKFTQ
ncbi:MAG: response regulator transcription factor [Crocinitomicaceae bacterium]|nr:response regulator transcription factor [Crocinitomicaceae bacterium]